MRQYDMKAEPGEKTVIELKVTDQTSIRVWVIEGKEPGKTLVATAGVHGCEYIGMEALRQLGQELEPENMSGRLILIPVVNEAGFYAGARQVNPSDGKNLNREFPGKEDGTVTQRIAKVLEQEIYPVADFLMDLHGGDVNEKATPFVYFPYETEEGVRDQARGGAASLSLPYRVRSSAKNGFYSWATQCGIPALLLERGGQGMWSEREIEAYKENVLELMAHLKMTEMKKNVPEEQEEISQSYYLEAPERGFWYPAVKEAGQIIKKGELLGQLKSMDGTLIASYYAEAKSVILYYTVSLGVQAGDPLIAYGSLESGLM